MSYLQDNTAFLGTGERDGKGKTLQEFLDAYDPKKYDCPSNTVDIAVFAEGELLLIRRDGHPNIGRFALPGIAARAIEDACTGSNPRQPSQEEMEKLLKCCYYDTEVDF